IAACTCGHRRVKQDRSALAIACELEIRQRVGPVEIKVRGVGAVRHFQYSVGIAILDGIEVDVLEIDLVGPRQRAVAGEAEYHAVERGGVIQYQVARRTSEGDGR